MTEPERFDICGPLPTGVTVLEASAGTGKTWTIASLTARYVAEGMALERLLIITFTRMATGELRERVRQRLREIEAGLRTGAHADDEVIRLLAGGLADEVALRAGRLRRAIAEFDAATIDTTHAFCQTALGSLGVTADVDPDATFAENVDDLAHEVISDLYVRRFRGEEAAAISLREATEIAIAAIRNPSVPLVTPRSGELPGMRHRLASVARTELDHRKRAVGLFTYDDQLTRLHATLGGESGPVAAARLSARFDVVLVDEFQDTDPVQWDILRRAFAKTGRTLVLIADPKQAIYSFRGADVYAYLAAAREATTHRTLDVNRRSDQGLIDAYDALFSGAQLGDTGIRYRAVRASDEHQAPRLAGSPCDMPLRVRHVPRIPTTISLTPKGFAQLNSAREFVAQDAAADIARLLNSGALVDGEAVAPRDIGVLVRTNRAAASIRDALDEVGVPAVINGAGSVFETEIAGEWLRLLEALERPSSSLAAHSAALTCFLGWSAEQVATAGDDAWEQVHGRLHDWARVLRTRGVAAALAEITLDQEMPARLLATSDGERRLTDLRHVGQLLHAEATMEQLGATALTAWLRRRIDEAAQDTANEDRSRRLESDAEAVQVLTIHRSKGLEFPIVYAPFLWDPVGRPKTKQPVSYFDVAASERQIDVSLVGGDYQRHLARELEEEAGEELRLMYVALTRARHQAVVWWVGAWQSKKSPLSRLLFARGEDGSIGLEASLPEDEEVQERLGALAAAAPGLVSVETAAPGAAVMWTPPADVVGALDAARLGRGIDHMWRRTSYSNITAGAHDAFVSSESDEYVLEDEPGEPEAPVVAGDAGGPASPWAGVPVGVRLGTTVHRVLERTDFAAADLAVELASHVGDAVADPPSLVTGLAAAIDTPLGPAVGGLRLRDLARADRLDELQFELPLAGGDEPRGWVALDTIAGVLREHLPAGDPMATYADRLGEEGLRSRVRGYLTGSLDLVARLPDGRFCVVDYKTNWLAAPGQALTVGHYRPGALTTEVNDRHYGLQALLYAVALHRYLRWRLSGYDPDRDVAGVLYLFLRGMIGPDTPVVDGAPCGVFAWQPSGALLEALSAVLDRGTSS